LLARKTGGRAGKNPLGRSYPGYVTEL